MYNKALTQRFFNEAKKVAEMSTFPKCHTGCIVVYRGVIISSGFNSTKTHPLQKIYNKERFDCDSTPHYMHAEIHALSSIINDNSIDWKRVHVYIYRISNKKYRYGLARPCPACMKLLQHLGIKNIHYTTDDGYAYEILDT